MDHCEALGDDTKMTIDMHFSLVVVGLALLFDTTQSSISPTAAPTAAPTASQCLWSECSNDPHPQNDLPLLYICHMALLNGSLTPDVANRFTLGQLQVSCLSFCMDGSRQGTYGVESPPGALWDICSDCGQPLRDIVCNFCSGTSANDVGFCSPPTAPRACVLVNGNGVGNQEEVIASTSTPQQCFELVHNYRPTASGMTWSSQQDQSCIAEYAMNGTDSSGQFGTCLFLPAPSPTFIDARPPTLQPSSSPTSPTSSPTQAPINPPSYIGEGSGSFGSGSANSGSGALHRGSTDGSSEDGEGDVDEYPLSYVGMGLAGSKKKGKGHKGHKGFMVDLLSNYWSNMQKTSNGKVVAGIRIVGALSIAAVACAMLLVRRYKNSQTLDSSTELPETTEHTKLLELAPKFSSGSLEYAVPRYSRMKASSERKYTTGDETYSYAVPSMLEFA